MRPVAGLVAQASSSSTEAEFRALAARAATPKGVRDALLLSADRFAADDDGVPGTAIERADQLERLGLYGVRVAMDALAAALRTDPVPGADALEAELERVLAGAHGLAEIRILNQTRGGALSLNDAARHDLELLLRSGTPQQRLVLPDAAAGNEVHAALLEALERWQARAENPLSAHPVRDAARVAVAPEKECWPLRVRVRELT